MCDVDDSCDVWDRTVRRARRERRCSGCRSIIASGDLYARTGVLYDGSWSDVAHCGRCDRLFRMSAQHIAAPGDAEFACGETWEDPPPEVAALAFVTPSEASEMLAAEYVRQMQMRRSLAAERRAT